MRIPMVIVLACMYIVGVITGASVRVPIKPVRIAETPVIARVYFRGMAITAPVRFGPQEYCWKDECLTIHWLSVETYEVE